MLLYVQVNVLASLFAHFLSSTLISLKPNSTMSANSNNSAAARKTDAVSLSSGQKKVARNDGPTTQKTSKSKTSGEKISAKAIGTTSALVVAGASIKKAKKVANTANMANTANPKAPVLKPTPKVKKDAVAIAPAQSKLIADPLYYNS